MRANDPIRISSEFATQPFRLLTQNAPMIWTDSGDFAIRLKQQDINLDLAEHLLSHQAPVVYADDLLALIETDGDVRVDIHKIKDIPTAVPPFDRMFVEVNMQPFVEKSKRASDSLRALAGYVVCDPFPKEQADKIRELVLIHAHKGKITFQGQMLRKTLGEEKLFELDTVLEQVKNSIRVPKVIFRTGMIDEESIPAIETARFVSIYPYILVTDKKNPKGMCIGPVGQVIYMVDTELGLVRLKSGEPWQLWLDPVQSDEETYLYEESAAFYDDCAQTTAALSMRIMALLNCSNVEMVDQGSTTDGMTKREIKQKRLQSLRYHELRVKVGHEMMPVCGRGNLTGGKALGMVRGHFKDYSRGKGLFGKYKKPSVWVPPHVRGDPMNGIIMKDYRIT